METPEQIPTHGHYTAGDLITFLGYFRRQMEQRLGRRMLTDASKMLYPDSLSEMSLSLLRADEIQSAQQEVGTWVTNHGIPHVTTRFGASADELVQTISSDNYHVWLQYLVRDFQQRVIRAHSVMTTRRDYIVATADEVLAGHARQQSLRVASQSSNRLTIAGWLPIWAPKGWWRRRRWLWLSARLRRIAERVPRD